MERAIALALAFWTVASTAFAQDLRVVTVNRIPFSYSELGSDAGFSIDLWAAIANELGYSYTIDRLDTFTDMLEEVESGRADVAAANISITAEREGRMDFSQPIFASGLRIMVHEDQTGSSLSAVLWSKDLLLAALFAFAMLFGGGMLMWRFERNAQDYFRGEAGEKAFPAFWWALNLVVNGGFEERVPRTFMGRIFATILVISSLFVVSIFVAHITAAMTVSAIQSSVNSVDDLFGKRVGTTAGSTTSDFLEARNLRHQVYPDFAALIDAFEAKELEAVAFDAPILSYYTFATGRGVGVLVGPTFMRDNYGFALPTDSPLRKPINRTLLSLTEDGTYRELMLKWFGDEAGY